MAKKDSVERHGEVTDIARGVFIVKCDDSETPVKCTLGGKIRMHTIRIVTGDSVDIECSTYDLTKGRIVYRHK